MKWDIWSFTETSIKYKYKIHHLRQIFLHFSEHHKKKDFTLITKK